MLLATKPLHSCPTRFLFNIPQSARLLDLDADLVEVDKRYDATKPKFLASWKKAYDPWRGQHTVANQIVALFKPMLEDYARLGCDSAFTISIRPTLFVKWNDVCRTALGSAALIIQPVICEFQRQLWLRMASDVARPAVSKLGPADGVHLSACEREQKLELTVSRMRPCTSTPPHTQRSRLMAGAKTTRVRKDGST